MKRTVPAHASSAVGGGGAGLHAEVAREAGGAFTTPRLVVTHSVA